MTKLIDIGGGSNHSGILFVSNNHEIEVKTYPNIEIGDVKLSIKSKNDFWHIKIIIPALAGFFAAGELIGNSWIPWNIFRPIVFSIYVTIIIYTSYYLGIKSFGFMRLNHGAEHKVIHAYINGKLEDENGVRDASRFSPWCGSGIMFPILIMLALGDWIKFPFTISIIYYFGYLHVGILRKIFYKIIGRPIQFLTTKEPPLEILEAAKIALLRLVDAEGRIVISD